MEIKKVAPVVLGSLYILNIIICFIGLKTGLLGGIGAAVLSFGLSLGVFALIIRYSKIPKEQLDLIVKDIAGVMMTSVIVILLISLLAIGGILASVTDKTFKGGKAMAFFVTPIALGCLLGAAKVADIVMKQKKPAETKMVNAEIEMQMQAMLSRANY